MGGKMKMNHGTWLMEDERDEHRKVQREKERERELKIGHDLIG